MKITFEQYPIDIIISILLSFLLVPIIIFDFNDTLRIILGLPFILFLPGYNLIFALFPTKKTTTQSIDILERIALSFGLSIAIVPLIGLILNYTPWGIRLEPILVSLILFITLTGVVGMYRWMKTSPDERFIIHFNLTIPKSKSKIDQALTIILVASILIAFIALIYVIATPKTGEHFTEFYLLGPEGKADNYPQDLSIGENATVIVGVVNHEYQTMNYTIEVWLINQTLIYNETTKENETQYHHMWFIDSIHISLNHTPIDIEEPWQPQWEYNWTFSINKTGSYKLAFLLFTTQTENYIPWEDYKDIAKEKIENAYRETHLWVHIT